MMFVDLKTIILGRNRIMCGKPKFPHAWTAYLPVSVFGSGTVLLGLSNHVAYSVQHVAPALAKMS